MNVNGEIDITFSVFRRMTLSYLGVRVLLLRIFAVCVFVYATWDLTRAGTPGGLLRFFPICAGIFAVPELFVLVLWGIQRKRITGPTRFAITADGLTVHRPATGEQVAWRDVARVQRGQYAWSVRPDNANPPILIPRRAFSADDRTMINDFFLRHPEFAG